LRRGSEYDPRVRTRIERASGMTAVEYIQLRAARADFVARVAVRTAGFDALLMPTVAITPRQSPHSSETRITGASTPYCCATHRSSISSTAARLPCRYPRQVRPLSRKGRPLWAKGNALHQGTAAALEKVPLGGNVKLVNTLAGLSFDLEGTDSHQLAIPPIPSVASQGLADQHGLYDL
jgi:hypothetical protein